MNTHLLKMKWLVFLCVPLMLASCFESKEVIRQVDCNSADLKASADSLKLIYAKDGFTVLQETQVSVKNDFEQPIMFPMQQGGHYQLIFIGDRTAKKWELRLSYMDSGGAVAVKKHLLQDGNVLTIFHLPNMTTRYVAHLYERLPNGPDNLCGYFVLMKKTELSKQ